jgi:hypothetical protein
MKDLLPKIYVSLEDTIQSKISSFTPPAIQWDQFCTLASEAQFQDEEQLLRAVNFLSDLGSLVFFEDEKTHERLIILNPQWLTGRFQLVIQRERERERARESKRERARECVYGSDIDVLGFRNVCVCHYDKAYHGQERSIASSKSGPDLASPTIPRIVASPIDCALATV